MLLECLNRGEGMEAITQVHEGLCGAHQSGLKMRWLLRRHGIYWLTILKDCMNYAKGCQECQKHGPLKHLAIVKLQHVVKPWPIRGWAMDVIGKISTYSSKWHGFIILATDCFTKWVEVEPMQTVTQNAVIKFLENIVYRFGIPQTTMFDNATIFEGDVIAFANKLGITMTKSIPYYAQPNGQAEATNKVIKENMAKMTKNNPRMLHEILPEVLWAYRTSKRTSTGASPYPLICGHEAILPIEIKVNSLRVMKQN